jgi:hypothetical protein
MAPKFQIRADVLVYALLVGGSTAATLAWTNYYGVSEEEKLKILVRPVMFVVPVCDVLTKFPRYRVLA